MNVLGQYVEYFQYSRLLGQLFRGWLANQGATGSPSDSPAPSFGHYLGGCKRIPAMTVSHSNEICQTGCSKVVAASGGASDLASALKFLAPQVVVTQEAGGRMNTQNN